MSKTIGKNTGNEHGYLAHFNGNKVEIFTNEGIYKAKLLAIEYFKIPKNKQHLMSINLCVKPENTIVIHKPNF